MTKLRLLVFAALFSALFASGAREARADVIALTSGGVATAGDLAQLNDIAGSGFWLRSRTLGPVETSPCPLGSQPCQGGQVITVSTTISVSFAGPASAVFGGVEYSNLALHGTTLNFVTGPFRLVSGSHPHEPTIYTVLVPFTMSGTIVASEYVDGTTPGPMLFTVGVTGQGIATVRILQEGANQYVFGATYIFQQPVPEPATVILLGTSLAGLTAYARRRRPRK